MKIILSRKGLDSSFGNIASPIFPNGKLGWLPIPEIDDRKNLYHYGDLVFNKCSLGDVIEDLSFGKMSKETTVHLDPDIFPTYVERDSDWHPLFGQTGAAESHLQNYGVNHGDVFLFFGWFRHIQFIDGKYRYIPHAPDLHVLYGWFQIEKKVKVNEYKPIQPWLKKHTHFQGEVYNKNLDTVYFPTKKLVLNGKETDLSGCGYFPEIHNELILTAPGQNRSVWKLPKWFYPENGKKALSYHGNLSRWSLDEKCAYLKSVGRGQEFVLDIDDYPQGIPWLESIIERYGSSSI